jgi:hypothetical protein
MFVALRLSALNATASNIIFTQLVLTISAIVSVLRHRPFIKLGLATLVSLAVNYDLGPLASSLRRRL